MSQESKPEILVVEDESSLASLYETWLGEEYEIHRATNGEEALDLVDDTIDVVLLDRRLPEMSGDELLGRIREKDLDCQVAMVTAVAPDFDILRLDIDEYVQKPVDEEKLKSVVSQLYRRKSIEEAISGFLQLVTKKDVLESEKSGDELEDHPEYKSLKSELVGRRRQIDSLLSELAESGIDAGQESRLEEIATESRPEPKPEPEPSGRSETHTISDVTDLSDFSESASPPPYYRTRKREFFTLWLLAALAYGVGDSVSTIASLRFVPGVGEANPLVASALNNFGFSGFIGVKVVVFVLLFTISVQGARAHDRFNYYWPPILATLLGIFLTGWNLWLILSVS